METSKKVRFKTDIEIHIFHDETNNFRKKYWEYFAVDRYRFKDRIYRYELVIAPILNMQHRKKIYNKYIA